MMKNSKSNKNDSNRLTIATLIIRGLLAKRTDNPDIPFEPVILETLTSAEAVAFSASAENAQSQTYPSPLVRSSEPPLFVDTEECSADPEKMRSKLSEEMSAYSRKYDCEPEVVCLSGLGIVYVDGERSDLELPLRNKVALVTGAAGAIGYGICQGLLEKGCYLAATDLEGERLDRLGSDLMEIAEDRVMSVAIDVTDKNSVVEGFASVIAKWGGVDIVIVNAGIPLVSPLIDIDLESFRKLEKVNVEGALLTLSEAGRLFIVQGTGGDIVVVSTKNVPSPGAGFGAYSVTKAACHQLGRIASIELAQYGVRVNMVAPDAVFSEGQFKSGLWEAIGPDRMRARGLDEEGLHEYYRSRNLLKARVTGRHVANAVLFFVTRQTPTTGATIPVDGGLPDATPR